MKSVIKALASVVVPFAASFAHAQPFLEFHVQGQVSIPLGVVQSEFKAVFDASAPTMDFDDGMRRLNALHTEFLQVMNPPQSPVLTGDPTIIESAPGSFTYDPPLDSLIISVGGTNITINQMMGDFSDIANSIPDDPEAYRIDTSNPNAAMFYSNTFAAFMRWTPAFGYQDLGSDASGAYTIRVRVVEDPNAPEPCIADLNDDGNLNFLDISKYLELYGDGCP
jgi:hypothetical protein